MFQELVKELANYGITGVLIAWLFWKDWKVTTRLFKVIENNTEALTELKDKINRMKGD